MRRRLLAVALITVLVPAVFYAAWTAHNNDLSGLVVARGSKLYVGDEEFRFLGANSFELWWYSPDEIREVIDTAHRHGIRVIRVFLGGTAFENPVGTYNEWNFKKLDYILAYCRLRGMYVIITLRDNNWAEDVYWVEADGTVNKTRMYTDPETIETFKRFISHVLNRVNVYNFRVYKRDPTILAWDVCNEPDGTVSDPDVLRRWVAEIVDYIKSIDSVHLVTVGLMDVANVEVIYDLVDVVSVHSYPSKEGDVDVEGLLSLNVDKPVILEEFGASQSLPRDVQAEVYETYLTLASENGFSGAMFWNLGLGHNVWDRWPEEDSHIFSVLDGQSGHWSVNTYHPSVLDRLFFSTGSSIQFMAKHSPLVTASAFVAALTVSILLLLVKKRRSVGEIPEEFSV